MTESHTTKRRIRHYCKGRCSPGLHYEPYEGMWRKHENRKANALLIAAAPDMLAALKDCLHTLGGLDAAKSGEPDWIKGSMDLAEAAIAKATGA